MNPLVNGEWSAAEAHQNNDQCLIPASLSGTGDAALRACAGASMDLVTTLQADLDGHPIENLHAFWFVSPPCSLTAAPGNPLGIPAGRTRSVADGFWLLFEPLSAGQCTLHVRDDLPVFGFLFKSNYTLTIVRPSDTCENIEHDRYLRALERDSESTQTLAIQ